MLKTTLARFAQTGICIRPRMALRGLILVTLAMASSLASAQTPDITGIIVDASGNPVAGASIAIEGAEATISDDHGRFSLHLAAGDWTLRISHPDYGPTRQAVTVNNSSVELEIRLQAPTSLHESVTVVGIRAGKNTPVTQRNMDRDEIDAHSYGQDIPALLQLTPSITSSSDAGTGSNYSTFSLRGIQQTRINLTLDGAPLNDPAEHALFFNNFHDFSSFVDSIQVQRGVGTSSVGSPSFGGSVNFATAPPSPVSRGDVRLGAGAYDTQRVSFGYETGLFGNGFSVSGRFSGAGTDGYRDNSGTEHRTFYLKAAWQGERSALKLTAFTGNEKTQLAFLAVDPDTLRENRRFNPLAEQERDDFDQRFAQLKYSRALNDDTLLTASVYTNGADGWFRLFGDPVAQTDLLEFAIDQSFWGSMFTLTKTTDNAESTVGVHYNDFSGDHTLDLGSSRLYKNTGFKQTLNAFAKSEQRRGRWLLFGDLQLRWAEFSYHGDIDLGSVDWLFVDPKVGARYRVSNALSLYGSLGRAQREPARLDLLAGEDNATVRHDLEATKPEEVLNVEIGVNLETSQLALAVNAYAMEFSNEIALTGELSEVGLPVRRNVADSYRRGLEIDLRWSPVRNWTLLHSMNLSRNRISEWTQFFDVFDAGGAWVGSEARTFRDVKPLLSPQAVANLGLEWQRRDTSIGLLGRYVAASQLDNTDRPDLRLPSYTNLDLRASLALSRWWRTGRPRLKIFVNNVFDNADQFPSGYSYQFINRDPGGQDTLDGIPFFFPLATRNVIMSLEIDL